MNQCKQYWDLYKKNTQITINIGNTYDKQIKYYRNKIKSNDSVNLKPAPQKLIKKPTAGLSRGHTCIDFLITITQTYFIVTRIYLLWSYFYVPIKIIINNIFMITGCVIKNDCKPSTRDSNGLYYPASLDIAGIKVLLTNPQVTSCVYCSHNNNVDIYVINNTCYRTIVTKLHISRYEFWTKAYQYNQPCWNCTKS